jgi:ribosomal protein S18 acetylase RimI-like enzyme
VLSVTETTLRPAVPADLPVIFRAERDYIKAIEPGQEAAWTAAIDRNLDLWIANLDRTTMLLAGTDIAGFVIWTPTPAYRDGAATLVTIQVRPAYRRRGYGRILLGVFAEQGAAAGYRLLHLGVHKDNPARALYEQAGYQPAGSDGDYLLYDLPRGPRTGVGPEAIGHAAPSRHPESSEKRSKSASGRRWSQESG